MTLTWRELWIDTTSTLGGTPEAANEARWIAQEASGRDGAELLVATLQVAQLVRLGDDGRVGEARLDRLVLVLQAGHPCDPDLPG